MKVERSKGKKPKFVPITIELTFESQQEVDDYINDWDTDHISVQHAEDSNVDMLQTINNILRGDV